MTQGRLSPSGYRSLLLDLVFLSPVISSPLLSILVLMETVLTFKNALWIKITLFPLQVLFFPFIFFLSACYVWFSFGPFIIMWDNASFISCGCACPYLCYEGHTAHIDQPVSYHLVRMVDNVIGGGAALLVEESCLLYFYLFFGTVFSPFCK